MSFLNNLLGKKEIAVTTNEEFWEWFTENELAFYNVVKRKGNVERDFFNKLSPKLKQLRDGYFYLTGMQNENTAELVITADGNIKNFVFVEELVKAAPILERWKFTALKQAVDPQGIRIRMGPYEFSEETLSFYADNDPNYPDRVSIIVIPKDYKEADKDQISNVVYVFLENYLGEFDLVSYVDYFDVMGSANGKDVIPLSKLKDYLVWRQKEFVERYVGKRYDTEKDKHSVIEAKLGDGNPLLAVINTDLLQWDSKASHPWVMTVGMKYKGTDGLPDDSTDELMQRIEHEITEQLKDKDGCLFIGRQTAMNTREVYFACNDFRNPSKVLSEISGRYQKDIPIDYQISKDKYWQQLEHFKVALKNA